MKRDGPKVPKQAEAKRNGVINPQRQKGGDLTQSYDKSPYTNRNVTTPQKRSIKQQLRTDLGRSVGVTTATQLVLLTWFTGPPSHSPQQPCNQKDTHLKICK